MKSLITRAWSGFKLAVFLTIKTVALRDRSLYYGRFFGSDKRAVLFLKNLVSPARLLTKIRYGIVDGLPVALRNGEPSPVSRWNPSVLAQANELRDSGFLLMDGARPDIADHISRLYADFLASVTPAQHYHTLILREIDQTLLQFMTDEGLLQIMAAYYNGRQPYLRAAGNLKSTLPINDRAQTRQALEVTGEYNTDWHYDTVNMLQIHFLLHDLTTDDTHMALVANQARTHRVSLTPKDYNYSDEYISKTYQTVPIVGKKGTILLWDSNAPHTAVLKAGRPRHFVQFLYTPGNDVLTHQPRYGKDWSIAPENLDLESLSPISRNSLKHVLDDRPLDQRKVQTTLRAGTQVTQKKKTRTELEISNF